MTLFSEIYNCYFQILKSLLTETNGFSYEELYSKINLDGFEESSLYILPKLSSGEWKLFKKEGSLYISKLSENFYVPLTDLQGSYIKTLLNDNRIRLFLDEKQIDEIGRFLGDVSLLWEEDTFYYYDRFADSDEFSNPKYKDIFRTLINAIEKKHYVDIEYISRPGHRVHHHYFPGRLEYSIKNNKFRLLALKKSGKNVMRLEILNLDRMDKVSILNETITDKINFNTIIKNSYYKEPLRLLIHNKRNALERTMLHFANYEKNTTKLDKDLYECHIWYNENMETELLIEVMSFGPMIEVLGNKRFLEQLKKRLKRQAGLFPYSPYT